MRITILISVLLLSACGSIRGRFHRVEKGETFSAIAGLYQVPVKALVSQNPTAVGRGLKPGMKVYIPFENRKNWNGEQLARAVANNDESSSGAQREPLAYDLSQARFYWPVSGNISSPFGPRHGRAHEGVDISAPRGAPVRAARAGRVIYSNNGISGYGNMIIIRHSDAFATVYAHLSRMHVKRGQLVERGALIGKVGSTGRSNGPHLHFEIRNRRVPVDPLRYLPGQYALAANPSSR